MSFVLVIVGGFLSARFGFLQIRGIKEWLISTVGSFFKRESKSSKHDKNSVSQIQSLCTSLAATIGTGNIAGVATALTLAGSGAIFWMWCSAFFSMAIGYFENVLGMLYRKKRSTGGYSGGAVCYIEHGLKMKGLAKAYALLLALTAFGIGNLVQVNSAAMGAVDTIKSIFGSGVANSPAVIIAVCAVLVIFIGIVTFGGLKTVTAVTEKLVPIMAFLYIAGCLTVIFYNYRRIPDAFLRIITSAFTPRSVLGGAAGFSVMAAIRQGVAFGVFSNEAGLGSSVSGHAAVEDAEPRKIGMWSMFEIFIDTVVICTLTALVILTSGVYDENAVLEQVAKGIEPVSGVPLAIEAFSSVLGITADAFISVMMVLFAVSSTAAWAYYGTMAIDYAFSSNKKIVTLYKIIFVILVPAGCLFRSAFVWELSEALNITLAIPNLAAVSVLSSEVVKYNRNLKTRQNLPERTFKNATKKSSCDP